MELQKSVIVAKKFAKTEEDAILELLNVAQILPREGRTLVDTLNEKGFKIYGIQSGISGNSVCQSRGVLEYNGNIITPRDVVLNKKEE